MTRFIPPPLGIAVFFFLSFGASLYFAAAAVQGDFGLFSRDKIQDEAQDLALQLVELQADVNRMENITRRLSDDFLDLDLLDERVRAVLGWLHSDEIIIY